MKNLGVESILASIKRITDRPDRNKYVGKFVSTINNCVKKKGSYETAVKYKNEGNLTNNVSSPDTTLEYEEVFDQNFNYTKDSGIAVSKSSVCNKDDTSSEDSQLTPKRIHFNPEISTIVEVEVQKNEKKPDYYYSTPYKYLTRLSETPKPQKVEYEYVPSREKAEEPKAEIITKEVLEAVNIIKETKQPERLIDLNEITVCPKENFVRNPSSRSLEEKFVVNLFESRQSKRWKRQSVCVANLRSSPKKHKPLTHDTHVEDRKPVCERRQSEETSDLDDDEMFQKLKRERDAECVKMNQASKVLRAIRSKPNRDWSEELLAERILLETDEKYKLIVNKIRDLKYSEKKPKSDHLADITLSSFKYALRAEDRKKAHKYSEFFILTLSNGTDFMMSRVTTPTNNALEFSESFTFKNVDANFNVKAKLFAIKLKTKAGLTRTLLKRKARNLCPMSKIYYENVHTYEMEESKVLKTSFIQCGEVTITKDDIGNSSLLVSNIPEESRIQSGAAFSMTLDNLKMDSKISGFLTLGVPDKNTNILYWERKWCVLDKTQLRVYNYPSDEDFGTPVTTINLEYCFVPFLTNVNNCCRKRNFLLKTGRPGFVNEKHNITLRKRPNFVLEKYYFTADNSADFQLWSKKINDVLNCLKDWKKLVFIDDYY